MKNIISGAVLAIGMIGSPVSAEENPIGREDSRKGNALMLTTVIGKRIDRSIQLNDSRQNEEWRRYTQKLVTDLLPGSPVSYRENGIQVIAYQLTESSKNRPQVYAGAFKSSNNSAINYGIMLSIPLGGK